MTLGDYIKKYREIHNMSMGQFAELSGISKAYISLLERNRHPTTGKPIAPAIQTIKMAAEAMDVEFNDLFSAIESDISLGKGQGETSTKSVKIRVYGRVAAGVPMEMIEDIYDEEEIPVDWTRGGKEYFGLVIHGDSMLPRMSEGDIIIVRKQPDAETGDTVVATVNGYAATCKVLRKSASGIELCPTNPAHQIQFFDHDQVRELPVKILGKVVELRAKY